MNRKPRKQSPEARISIRLPRQLVEEMWRAVAAETRRNPARRFTLSDEIRERLINGGN